MAPDLLTSHPDYWRTVFRNAEDKKKQHQPLLAALHKISIKINNQAAADMAVAATHMEIPCGMHS